MRFSGRSTFLVECSVDIKSTTLTAMGTDLQTAREQAHILLDVLPDEKLVAVSRLLEVMVEPLSSFLLAVPEEDEDLTPETIAALERARVSIHHGEGIAHDELLRELSV